MNKIVCLVAGTLAAAALTDTAFVSAQAADLIGIRVGRHPEMTRLVLDLDGPMRYRLRYGEDYRIILTFEGEGPLAQVPVVSGSPGLIQAIETMDPARRELVIRLSGPAEVMREFHLDPESAADAPHRIVFDLRSVPRADWARLAATAAAGETARGPALANVTAQRPRPAEAPGPEPESAPAREPESATETDPAPPRPGRSPAPALRAGLFDGLSIDGYVELEGRAFPEKSQEPGPRPDRLSGSVALEPTFSYSWNDGRSLVSFTPFARLDSNDGKRSHVDIRELKWVGAFDRIEARIGIDKMFWGVVESQHLVDIINQDDMLEDVDGEDKLGQPLAGLSYDSDFGLFSAYAMTYFRERRFAGSGGRPRGPLPVATELAQYEAGSDKWHVDWALRWSHYLGPFDVALSHFSGTSRDPQLIPAVTTGGAAVLIPRYNLIDQSGIELQAVTGAWLWKAEAIRRAQPGENQYAAIGGFEYTFYQILNDGDLGVLAEYLWDERRDPIDNPFEDDLFLALRWTANDLASTTVLAGTILDLDSRARFITLEASRRFGSVWRIGLDARLFLSIPDDDPLYFFRDDSFLQLKLQRHF